MKRYFFTLLSVLLFTRAWADAAYIPPESPQATITRTASGQPVDIRSGPYRGGITYDAKTGTIRPTNGQFSGATGGKGTSGGTATKTNPVTMTGTYGEKATGSVRTQTTLPSNSSLSRGFGTLAVGAMATAHHQGLQAQGVPEQISRSIAAGDWLGVAAGIGRAMDWTGIGGIYAQALYGNPAVQQHVIAPMQQQTLEAARQQFDDYQQRQSIDPADYKNYKILQLYAWTPMTINERVRIALEVLPADVPNQTIVKNVGKTGLTVVVNGKTYTAPDLGPNTYIAGSISDATPALIEEYRNSAVPPIAYPTEAQWAAAMEAFLNSSHATNEALRDLTNALWANGVLNPNNTQTAVIGGDAANTFLSAPYTPAGAQTAQQTQFLVHPDGRVSTGIVSRPDLGAHSSQAPTRSPLGGRKRPDIDIDIDADSDAASKPKAQEVEICEEDDEGKLVCLQAGSDDYEDLELPKNEISLEFERKEYFDDGGSCPANPQFQFLGHSYTFSYKPICAIAQWVAPMIELAGIVTAAGIAYAAVREL